MKEQLVTYDTAILAKKKGFDIPVQYGVYGPKMKLIQDLGFRNNPDLKLVNWNAETKQQRNSQATSIPSQSLLKDWFWKTHKIWVEITLWGDGVGFICVVKQAKGKEDDGSTIVKQLKAVETGLACSEPSKALEQGLKEVLKLI